MYNIKSILNTASADSINCLIAPLVIFKITFAEIKGKIAPIIASTILTIAYPIKFILHSLI